MVIRIYHSSELNGLKGDSGEEWCVFFRNGVRPLDSTWTWVRTRGEAAAIAEEARNKMSFSTRARCTIRGSAQGVGSQCLRWVSDP